MLHKHAPNIHAYMCTCAYITIYTIYYYIAAQTRAKHPCLHVHVRVYFAPRAAILMQARVDTASTHPLPFRKGWT